MGSTIANTTQSLAGKVAVITGSSAGIGAATAVELGRRGANVVLNYPFPSLKNEADAIGALLVASEWIAVEADLSTVDGPRKLIAEAVARFGAIDILVNNAARVLMAPFDKTTLEQWQISMDTNARGMFLTTQAALPHLRKEKGKEGERDNTSTRIINVISSASREPEVNQTAYAASKAATDAMTKTWAVELPPIYGCTVNSVAPGVIMTQGSKVNLAPVEDIVKPIFEARTPLPGWYGEPEDIAWTVAFLAEDRSSWINGASINVSGGMFRT